MQLYYPTTDAPSNFKNTVKFLKSIRPKLIISLLSMMIFTPLISNGQDKNFESGISYFENTEYLNAIISFSNALNNKFLMDGDILPLAYSYRAKSIVMQYKKSIESKDTLFLSQFPNILITAFDDIEKARTFGNKRDQDLLNDTEQALLEVTTQFGQMVVDVLILDQNTGQEVDSLVNLINEEIGMLEKYRPESYKVKDMLGLLAYKAGELEKAKSYFEASEEIYNSRLDVQLDVDHLYNYYYTAWINYRAAAEIGQSLAMLKVSEKHIFRAVEFEEKEDVRVKMMSLSKKIDNLEFQLKLLSL